MKKLLFIALALAGCVGADHRPTAVPRPRAYPRAELYPEAYSPVEAGGITLMVNDSARVSVSPGGWVDIAYPAYGVTVNCTVTPVCGATLGSVLDNRSERMALNAGSAYGEITRLTAASGAGATLLESHGAGLTPLQFLATDSSSWVLSGAATMADVASTDSIRPVIDALRADIIFLLKEL